MNWQMSGCISAFHYLNFSANDVARYFGVMSFSYYGFVIKHCHLDLFMVLLAVSPETVRKQTSSSVVLIEEAKLPPVF